MKNHEKSWKIENFEVVQMIIHDDTPEFLAKPPFEGPKPPNRRRGGFSLGTGPKFLGPKTLPLCYFFGQKCVFCVYLGGRFSSAPPRKKFSPATPANFFFLEKSGKMRSENFPKSNGGFWLRGRVFARNSGVLWCFMVFYGHIPHKMSMLPSGGWDGG